MARVRALTKLFIDNSIREEGAVFEYTGPHNRHLEYLDQVEGDEEPVQAQAPKEPKPKRKWTPKAQRAADKGSA